jgi:uncharacterized protein (TIGR02186 family)
VKRFLPILLLFFWIESVHAQDANAPESFQIGLSTNRVAISSDFSGADLTIFGALDNADQVLARQGRYDIVVVLEGPARPVTVRKKTRVLGVWVNTQSQSFTSVPMSYAVATTRPMQDITQPIMYQRLALGSENIFMRAVEEQELRDPEKVTEFTAALRQQKRATGLYNERVGGVQFLSPSLFRATLSLAPNVPVGTHRARAFLFRNGVFVKETSAQLTIVKAGLEQRIYRTAQENGLFFGFAAVLLAVITGWLGRIIFKRD